MLLLRPFCKMRAMFSPPLAETCRNQLASLKSRLPRKLFDQPQPFHLRKHFAMSDLAQHPLDVALKHVFPFAFSASIMRLRFG